MTAHDQDRIESKGSPGIGADRQSLTPNLRTRESVKMGMSINEAVIFAEFVERHGLSGRIATLGVPALHFTPAEYAAVRTREKLPDGPGAVSARDFLAVLGFEAIHFVDVSDYEGADVVLDLGGALPAQLVNAFDVVFDCGTLEHIFNVPVALDNIAAMLRPGGWAVHLTLMNNGVDHGFYQFGPTLFFDYYGRAGFEMSEALSLSFDPLAFATTTWTVRPLRRGSFSNGHLGTLDSSTALLMILARKTGAGPPAPRPIQYIYAAERTSDVTPRWFPTYEMTRGSRRAAEAMRTRLDKVSPDAGYSYVAALPASAGGGNDETQTVRSTLLLLEDGRPLGPMNWSLAGIRGDGRGAYNHWKANLYFSSSDNTSPLHNGRIYEAVFETGEFEAAP